MRTLFLYDIEFDSDNPPHRKDEFEESFRGFFRSAGLRFLMGALGGRLHTYGAIWREAADVSQTDREAVASFVRLQPIRATARLGDLEKETEATDFLRDITEWVFDVDGLSDEDRFRAAEWDSRIQGRPPSPGRGPA
jgi:hypothetical protein